MECICIFDSSFIERKGFEDVKFNLKITIQKCIFEHELYALLLKLRIKF